MNKGIQHAHDGNTAKNQTQGFISEFFVKNIESRNEKQGCQVNHTNVEIVQSEEQEDSNQTYKDGHIKRSFVKVLRQEKHHIGKDERVGQSKMPSIKPDDHWRKQCDKNCSRDCQ